MNTQALISGLIEALEDMTEKYLTWVDKHGITDDEEWPEIIHARHMIEEAKKHEQTTD